MYFLLKGVANWLSGTHGPLGPGWFEILADFHQRTVWWPVVFWPMIPGWSYGKSSRDKLAELLLLRNQMVIIPPVITATIITDIILIEIMSTLQTTLSSVNKQVWNKLHFNGHEAFLHVKNDSSSFTEIQSAASQKYFDRQRSLWRNSDDGSNVKLTIWYSGELKKSNGSIIKWSETRAEKGFQIDDGLIKFSANQIGRK